MFALYQRKWDARRVYLILCGARALLFTLIFSANMIYQVQTVGLTPLQLVLVGTTLEVSVLLFEVPTGVVADVYSRRLSIIIGFAVIGLGFMIEGLFPVFEAVVLGSFVWGLGYTFTSGATQAWITDEVGEENVGDLFLRGSQIDHLAGIAGTVLAIILGSIVINLPIVLSGALLIVTSIFFVLVMPETGFKPTPRENRSRWTQMSGTLRDGLRLVRGRPALLAILGVGLFYGLFSEGYDRLNTAHLLTNFTLPDVAGLQPIVWINLFGIASGLLATAVLGFVRKRVDMTNSTALARASFLASGLLSASLIGFALAGNLLAAVLLHWAVNVCRAVVGPIYDTWINQHTESSVRATVISMAGQVDAFGQIAGGPPVGLIGERFGIRAALVASGLILSPVLVLFARILRREKVAVAVSAAD